MRKVKLDVDALAVQSFRTTAGKDEVRGTVEGNAETLRLCTNFVSCDGNTCPFSCFGSCDPNSGAVPCGYYC